MLLKSVLSYAGTRKIVRETLENSHILEPTIKRFVCGSTEEESLKAAAQILNNNFYFTIAYLGEHNTEIKSVEDTVQVYINLIKGINEICDIVNINTEISIKLSAIGGSLAYDKDKIIEDNTYLICSNANKYNINVTFDMENHETTDRTITTVKNIRKLFPDVGIAIQAALHRSESDCKELAADKARVRICKGAYHEPKNIAYQKKPDIDASYLRCLKILMSQECYPMVASHQPKMIKAAEMLAAKYKRDPNSYEHQMLLGVNSQAQTDLRNAGKKVRIYMPYGSQWYEYFLRRVLEKPSNAMFVLQALSHPR